MKTTELRKFCKKAKKIYDKNNTLPVLDCILIKDNQMIFYNLGRVVILKDVNFQLKKGLVPLDFFKKIVDKNKEIDLINQNGTIAIKTLNSVYTLPNDIDTEDFPLLPEFKEKQKDKICLADIQRVKKSVNYTAKDKLRPVMECVNVTDRYIVATDAHILSFHKREKNGKFQFLMDKKIINILEDDDYQIIYDEKTTCLKGSVYEYYYKNEENKYPRWEGVLPSEFHSFCKVTASNMKETLEEAEPAVNQASKTIKLFNAIDRNILHVRGNDIDFNIGYKCNLKAENSGNKLLIGVSLALLNKMFKTEEYQELNFKFVDEKSGMIINEEILLMPQELEWNEEEELNENYNICDEDLNQTPRETKPKNNSSPKSKNNKKTNTGTTKKSQIKKQNETMEKQKQSIQIIEYTEKSIAVIGNTKPLKEELKAINGRFNKYLKNKNGERFVGWIFSKKKEQEVKETLNL